MPFEINENVSKSMDELLRTARQNGLGVADIAGILTGAAFGLVASEAGPEKAALWLRTLAANPPLQARPVN